MPLRLLKHGDLHHIIK